MADRLTLFMLITAALQLTMAANVAVAAPSLPGQTCQSERKSERIESWSQAEIWAWTEICVGRIADFNKRYRESLEPTKSDGWGNGEKDRAIRGRFR